MIFRAYIKLTCLTIAIFENLIFSLIVNEEVRLRCLLI